MLEEVINEQISSKKEELKRLIALNLNKANIIKINPDLTPPLRQMVAIKGYGSVDLEDVEARRKKTKGL